MKTALLFVLMGMLAMSACRTPLHGPAQDQQPSQLKGVHDNSLILRLGKVDMGDAQSNLFRFETCTVDGSWCTGTFLNKDREDILFSLDEIDDIQLSEQDRAMLKASSNDYAQWLTEAGQSKYNKVLARYKGSSHKNYQSMIIGTGIAMSGITALAIAVMMGRGYARDAAEATGVILSVVGSTTAVVFGANEFTQNQIRRDARDRITDNVKQDSDDFAKNVDALYVLIDQRDGLLSTDRSSLKPLDENLSVIDMSYALGYYLNNHMTMRNLKSSKTSISKVCSLVRHLNAKPSRSCKDIVLS